MFGLPPRTGFIPPLPVHRILLAATQSLQGTLDRGQGHRGGGRGLRDGVISQRRLPQVVEGLKHGIALKTDVGEKVLGGGRSGHYRLSDQHAVAAVATQAGGSGAVIAHSSICGGGRGATGYCSSRGGGVAPAIVTGIALALGEFALRLNFGPANSNVV